MTLVLAQALACHKLKAVSGLAVPELWGSCLEMTNICSIYAFELIAYIIRVVGYKTFRCLCALSELINVGETVGSLELGDFFLEGCAIRSPQVLVELPSAKTSLGEPSKVGRSHEPHSHVE